MLTGVILAGGQNKRMRGIIKGLLPFGEEKIIHRQIKEMERICSEIILVTNEPKHYLPEVGNHIRIITDYYKDNGPLCGMHAALSLTKANYIWVVACDMPFICSNAAKLLLTARQKGDEDAALPVINGVTYPLHAIYRRSCLETIVKSLENKEYRIEHLINKIRWKRVTDEHFEKENINTRFIIDFNTSREYEELLKLVEAPK